MLAFPSLTPFEDLERGLAAGDLVDANVDLRFTPTSPAADVDPAGARFGTVRGVVRLGAKSYRVNTPGAASEGLPPPAPRPSVRLVLPGTTLGNLDLRSSVAADVTGDASRPFAAEFRFDVHGTAWRGTHAAAARGVADVRPGAATLRLRLDGEGGATTAMNATLERPIPVRRPGAAGSVVETVYALCRIDGAPTGWLELSVDRSTDD
jgi:hypothetical protein